MPRLPVKIVMVTTGTVGLGGVSSLGGTVSARRGLRGKRGYYELQSTNLTAFDSDLVIDDTGHGPSEGFVETSSSPGYTGTPFEKGHALNFEKVCDFGPCKYSADSNSMGGAFEWATAGDSDCTTANKDEGFDGSVNACAEQCGRATGCRYFSLAKVVDISGNLANVYNHAANDHVPQPGEAPSVHNKDAQCCFLYKGGSGPFKWTADPSKNLWLFNALFKLTGGPGPPAEEDGAAAGGTGARLGATSTGDPPETPSTTGAPETTSTEAPAEEESATEAGSGGKNTKCC